DRAVSASEVRRVPTRGPSELFGHPAGIVGAGVRREREAAAEARVDLDEREVSVPAPEALERDRAGGVGEPPARSRSSASGAGTEDRKSTRVNSSHHIISYRDS